MLFIGDLTYSNMRALDYAIVQVLPNQFKPQQKSNI